MKRVGLLAVAVVLVVSAYVAGMQPWADVTAQDEQIIPVQFSRYLGDVLDVGDSCSQRVLSDDPFSPTAQIVVKDESGKVIAIQDLEGTVELSSSGSNFCKADLSIAVPDASIYTVYLGDFRLVAFTESDFPIPPEDAIWVAS